MVTPTFEIENRSIQTTFGLVTFGFKYNIGLWRRPVLCNYSRDGSFQIKVTRKQLGSDAWGAWPNCSR